MTIRWGRVIVGALLLELVLFAVLVPIGRVNGTLFLFGVPIGAFVFGYLVAAWVLRTIASARWANAALLGVLATAVYLAIVLATPGGMGVAIATYGLPLFVFSNTMRIAGCLAAAFDLRRRAGVSTLA
jgi:hypothetical protein